MPRLALFAQRDIHAGEELTFDYASSCKIGNWLIASADPFLVFIRPFN